MADSTDFRKWLERAGQDLRLIEVIKKDGVGGLEESFCYTCNQAAEKLLKSYLLKREHWTPRTHDLVYLLSRCVHSAKSLRELQDEMMVLNEYSVSARYPSDFEEARTPEEAEEAYVCITTINTALKAFF